MRPLGFHVANNKEATAAPNFYGYGERYFDQDEKDVMMIFLVWILFKAPLWYG